MAAPMDEPLPIPQAAVNRWTIDDDLAVIHYLDGADPQPGGPWNPTSTARYLGASGASWYTAGLTDQHTGWHTWPTIGTDEEEQ
jgi:hypothetical protein